MQGEVKEYLIRKGGYFYRPNCQGYTTRKVEAGRYTKAKAEAEAAVEPWHMSAVHQDDVPDEPAVADLNAGIARLQEQVETQRIGHQLTAKEATDYLIRAKNAEAGLEEMTRSCLAERTGRLAAEAERDRLREGENRLNLGRENLRETMLAQATSGRRETYTDGFHQGLCYAIERLDLIIAAALQKEPQP